MHSPATAAREGGLPTTAIGSVSIPFACQSLLVLLGQALAVLSYTHIHSRDSKGKPLTGCWKVAFLTTPPCIKALSAHTVIVLDKYYNYRHINFSVVPRSQCRVHSSLQTCAFQTNRHAPQSSCTLVRKMAQNHYECCESASCPGRIQKAYLTRAAEGQEQRGLFAIKQIQR